MSIIPGQCGGHPRIRGMQVRLGKIPDLLAVGVMTDSVIPELPNPGLDEVRTCPRVASHRVNELVLNG